MHPERSVRGWAVVLALAAQAGCIGSTTTTSTYTIEQAALLPVPRAFRATGPLLEPGRTCLEGGFSHGVVGDPTARRAEGAPGHLYQVQILSARVARGIGERFELGGGVDWGGAGLARPTATDLDASSVGDSSSIWLSSQLRALVGGTRRRGLLWNVEASFGNVSYNRRIRIDTTSTYRSPTRTTGTTHTSSTTANDNLTEYVLGWATGPTAQLSVGEPMVFQFGGLVQSAPWYPGMQQASQTCTASGLQSECYGETARDVDASKTALLVTVFAGGTLRLDAFEIGLQGWSHLGSDAGAIVRAARMGVSATVRFVF